MTVRGRTDWQKLVDEKLEDHDKRLTEHEKELAVYQALQDEQRKHLDERFNRIQDNMNKTNAELAAKINATNSGISRLGWLVVGAVVLAITQWVISGGLFIVRP